MYAEGGTDVRDVQQERSRTWISCLMRMRKQELLVTWRFQLGDPVM